ncbi:uncharacterized protein TNCV_1818241 [Trichonephila clavipes]|nr:uncharacterized protein TNCV_1818241 [Trichonephila clavipes]
MKQCSRTSSMYRWPSADKRFKTVFETHAFGLSDAAFVIDFDTACRDLKKVKHRNIFSSNKIRADENVTEFRLCITCSKSIDAKNPESLSRSNVFRYPSNGPSGLPLLDPISIRLISNAVTIYADSSITLRRLPPINASPVYKGRETFLMGYICVLQCCGNRSTTIHSNR